MKLLLVFGDICKNSTANCAWDGLHSDDSPPCYTCVHHDWSVITSKSPRALKLKWCHRSHKQNWLCWCMSSLDEGMVVRWSMRIHFRRKLNIMLYARRPFWPKIRGYTHFWYARYTSALSPHSRIQKWNQLVSSEFSRDDILVCMTRASSFTWKKK
jgi:hypothetical protein